MNVIVDKVLQVLNSLNGVNTVMYDSGFSANVRIDRATPPFALLYLINQWNVDIAKTTSVKETANIQVFFFEPVNFGAKGEEKDIVVKKMYEIARDFIREMLEIKGLTINGTNVPISSSYGKFDKFCAGVVVELSLTEIQGKCL